MWNISIYNIEINLHKSLLLVFCCFLVSIFLYHLLRKKSKEQETVHSSEKQLDLTTYGDEETICDSAIKEIDVSNSEVQNIAKHAPNDRNIKIKIIPETFNLIEIERPKSTPRNRRNLSIVHNEDADIDPHFLQLKNSKNNPVDNLIHRYVHKKHTKKITHNVNNSLHRIRKSQDLHDVQKRVRAHSADAVKNRKIENSKICRQ